MVSCGEGLVRCVVASLYRKYYSKLMWREGTGLLAREALKVEDDTS